MSERRVVDHDVFGLDALGLQIGFEDLVGGARIDIVRAGKHPAFHRAAFRAHEIVDGRDGLLVRRGARVEDVALGFLTLVLHGVEENGVELLEDRQNRLARHRGPAAKHRCNLVLGDELAGLFGKQRPVRRRIDNDGLKLLAEDAAFLVLLINEHEHHVFQRGLADGHGAREGVENTHLDRIGSLSAERREREAAGENGAGSAQHGPPIEKHTHPHIFADPGGQAVVVSKSGQAGGSNRCAKPRAGHSRGLVE